MKNNGITSLCILLARRIIKGKKSSASLSYETVQTCPMCYKGENISETFPKFSFEKSVLKLLVEGLEYNDNKVVQIEADTDKSYTFADILHQSKSIAAGLRKAGIAPGDYVVICCIKSSLAYSVQLGVMFAGAIAVLIDVQCASDIYKLTKGHTLKAVFCDKTYLNVVNNSLNKMNTKPILIATTDRDDTTMKTLLLKNEFQIFEIKDIRNTVVVVLFTSGSTSDPKGVEISDLGLQRLGYSYVDETIKSHLLTRSFAWISSTGSLVSSIFKGYSIVMTESNDPAQHLKIIGKYRVNSWNASAGNINLYIKEASRACPDLSSLTVVNVVGTVVSGMTIKRFVSEVLKGKIGAKLLYGMTESGPITTWRNKDLLDQSKADSSGYIAPGVEVKITDEKGQLATAGDIGELRVKSLSLMVGYWGQHAGLNAEVFDSDGFFRTGDAGYIDNDGFLYIVGRVNDIITHESFKISISLMEDLLKSHPGVMDAAIVAKPHPSGVHDLFAFIVVKPGCDLREDDVALLVAGKMEGSIKLKGVHRVEAIPKTYSGKVQRRLLQDMIDKLHSLIH